MPSLRSKKLPFKPRARMLSLLGDQLIRDSRIAVFELVKNAYDADATKVQVTILDLDDPEKARIAIRDNGTGMDWDTVTNVWLEPGTDFRLRQREAGERTAKGRLPLGEKGIGRFAAHKLGQKITLITRKRNCPEIVVNIDWDEFEGNQYLTDAMVFVEERSPEKFVGRKSGTLIRISELRDKWTRGMVRNLHRAVTSICSPFDGPSGFMVELVVRHYDDWLKGLLKASEVLELSLFQATGSIDGRKLSYKYCFRPYPGMDRVKPRRTKKTIDLSPDLDLRGSKEERLQIGPVKFDLHIFDRDPQVLSFGASDIKGLTEFLKESGGIRVYRDGVRVYDYGERGNDWLELGGRRVNIPTRRISNNIVVGAVSLSLEESENLVEKTNREGFVENEACKRFREAVIEAVTHIEAERNIDKERVRIAYTRKRQKEPVLADLEELRKKIEQRKLEKELGPYLDRIEEQFRDVRDRLLTAAGAGLSLAVVIHEVEKGISELSKAVERDIQVTRIRELAKHLSDLVDSLTYLTRKSGFRKEKASAFIRRALFNTEFRFQYHSIEGLNGLENGDEDFSVRCSRRLIIATLMNLIDNSIWWLDQKSPRKKRIYIGTTNDLEGGAAIIVADNGPGFMDPPEYLIQPFFSRKPDGMGLGLHIASEVMKVHEGRLEFPEEGDVELPKGFKKGAVVALVFGDKK